MSSTINHSIAPLDGTGAIAHCAHVNFTMPWAGRPVTPPPLMCDLMAIILRSYELLGWQTVDPGSHAQKVVHLSTPVRHPEIWSSTEVMDELGIILRSYWGRRFKLSFSPLHELPRALHASIGTVMQDSAGTAPMVLAFSPDPDSISAVLDLSRQTRQPLILVTLDSTTEKTLSHGGHGRGAARRLAEQVLGDRVLWARASLPLPAQTWAEGLVSGAGRLLHVVITAAVSLGLGLEEARFFENGVTNLRLPATATSLARPAIHTVHPQLVDALNRVITRISRRPFRLHNPLTEKTPTEVVGDLAAIDPDILGELIDLQRQQHGAASDPHHRLDQHISILGALMGAGLCFDRHEQELLSLLIEPLNENLADAYIHAVRELPALPDDELSRRLLHAGANAPREESGAATATWLLRRHASAVRNVLAWGIRQYSQQLTTGELPPWCLLMRAVMPRNTQSDVGQPKRPMFRRRSDRWEIAYESGEMTYLNDCKGLRYIHLLLQHAGRSFSAIELSSIVAGLQPHGNSDLGTLLDRRAVEDYRKRLQELEAEEERAREHNDLGRLSRIQKEIGAVEAELSRGLGLGGRMRRNSDSERARKAVCNAVKRAMKAIRAQHPALSAHLRSAVKLGAYLCYAPHEPVSWHL